MLLQNGVVELQIRHATRTQLLASGEFVVVRILDGHNTDFEDIDRIAELIETEKRDARLAGFFQVICQGTPQLDPEVRRYAAKILDSYGDRACTVVVLLGLGFWTATLRLALSAFTSMMRNGKNVHIEGKIEAGAQTLARELIGLNAEELCEAYAELYEHMRTL